MSTLSKTVIRSIAQKMTQKSSKNLDYLRLQLSKITTDIYEQSLPDDLKKLFKKHCDYFNTSSYVYLDGHGFNRESIRLTKQLPSISDYRNEFKINANQADKIMKIKRELEKAEQEYKQLFSETENALLALKTQKNIRENLPEAIPFLPPPISNSLVVNFASLQKKLNKQPDALLTN